MDPAEKAIIVQAVRILARQTTADKYLEANFEVGDKKYEWIFKEVGSLVEKS